MARTISGDQAPAAPILEVRNASKAFPGVKALDDVSVNFYPGEVHALMGENGAGKSTLIKLISGVYKFDTGQMLLNGKVVVVANPVEAQRHGISYVPQEIGIEPFMTVVENIYLGRFIKTKLGTLNKRAMRRGAQKVLDQLDVHIPLDKPAGELSVAQQQMVTIARALSTESELIIFDEATSSLTQAETDSLIKIIRTLRDRGLAIAFVTHRMDELYELCDRVTILRDGANVHSCLLDTITMGEIIHHMVGRHVDVYARAQESSIAEEVLCVENLNVPGVLHDISFTLRAGEILGFAGLMGSGRTEVARAIFGDLKRQTGKITIRDVEAKIANPSAAIRVGIALVPEDRKADGLILHQSVRKNIGMAVLGKLAKFGITFGRHEKSLAEKYVEDFKIRTPSVNQEVRHLSGGNQQRVVIAKWLATNPQVLIVDEPTRGIDVGAKAELHHQLDELAQSGMAIILISSELPELVSLARRVLVMYRGTIQGELLDADITQENIITLATGSARTERQHVNN